MKKRFISLLLAVITCISVFPCTIHAASASFDDALGLMNAIGVFSGRMTEDDAKTPMSRLDFALLMAELLAISEDSASENDYFYDIPEDHWGKKKINAMVGKNLIAVGDHYFRPDDTITKAEATTIIVTALGRQTEAGFRGGFPNGYISVAIDLKLFRGVAAADNLTYKDAIILLYNAAIEEVAYVNGNRNGMVFEKSKQTLLSLHHDIYFGEGYINAIDGISLDGSTAGENGIIIDEAHYGAENWYYDYLGMKVKYFFRENDDEYRRVFYVINERKSKQESITISSNCYDGYRGNRIVYRETPDSVNTKDIKIFPGATVIVNGERANSDMASALNQSNIYGTIRVVDTEQFDGAELIIIENYENRVVTYIDKEKKQIYSKNSTTGGLNLNEEDGICVKYFGSDGAKATFDGIAIGGLISAVVSSTGDFVIVRLGDKTVSGIVSEKGTDVNGFPYFIVDGVFYNADSNFYTQYGSAVTLGANVSFGLDALGNIAAVSDVQINGMQYACLIDARITTYALDMDLGSEYVVLKLYTSLGEHISVPCAERVNIDGITYKKHEDILEYFSKFGTIQAQGIRYKTDSKGFVKNIDTIATPQTDKDFTLRKINTSDAVYYHWSGLLGNVAYLPADVPVMLVPQKNNIKNADHKQFSMKNRSSLLASRTYNMEILTSDPDSCVPEIIICYMDSVTEAADGDAFYVVEKKKKGMNSDNEMVTRLTLDNNSGDMEYFVSLDYEKKPAGTWNHVDPDTLTPGDIIRIGVDAVGDIVDIRLVIDYSKAKENSNSNFFENAINPAYILNENSMAGANFNKVTGYGYVSKKIDGTFAWGYNSPKDINQLYSSEIESKALKVMVFDDEPRSNKCTAGTINDLISYEESAASFSKIVTMQNDKIISQIVIYK